jgi:hypothetical protein
MMKKPARYIITGVDATGVSTPVLARVKCENSSGSFESIFPVEAGMDMHETSGKRVSS